MISQVFNAVLLAILLSNASGYVDIFSHRVKYGCDISRIQLFSSTDRIMRNWKIQEIKEKVFEGDMIVTEQQKKRWKLSGYLKENENRLIQDKWPSNTITYRMGRPAPNKKLVQSAMNEWSSRTCIKFVEGTNNALTITKSVGCYAQLGYAGKKEMSVSDLCDKGSVVHLLGHVIGLIHQHSRPDRDNYVSIQHQNTAIQDVQYLNYKDFDKCPYDYHSVMHFDMYGLSYNGESVFWGKSKDTDGIMLSSGIGIDWSRPSDSDVALVNREYGCPGTPCAKTSVTQPACNQAFIADVYGAQKTVLFSKVMANDYGVIRCVWKTSVAKSLDCSRAAIAVSLSESPDSNVVGAWFASGCRLFQVEIYDPDAEMTHFYCAAQFGRKPTKVFVATGRTIYAIAKLYPSNWENFMSSAMYGFVKMFNIKDLVCMGEINGKCY